MDKAGRKALLYTSSMLMFLSTLTLTMISHTTPCPPGPTPPEPTPSNLTLGLDHNSYEHALQAAAKGSGSIIPLISTMVFIFGEK